MQLFVETFLSLSPLYVYIMIGALLRKTGIIDSAFLPKLNQLAFRVFLSVMMFCDIYEADLDFGQSIGTIAYIILTFVLLFCILVKLIPRIVAEKSRAATVVQGLFRSNFVLLGVIYVRQLFGEAQVSGATILVAIIVPLFNVLAVLCFSLLTGERQKISAIILKILTNPLIIGTLAGFVARGTRGCVPTIVLNPLCAIADAATPFVMIIIGASITLGGMKKDHKLLIAVALTKLIAVPLVFVAGAVAVGFRGVTLVALLAAFGGPCAASSSAMADQLGGDGELAGEFIAVTTLFSLPTMYLFIVLLRGLGLC